MYCTSKYIAYPNLDDHCLALRVERGFDKSIKWMCITAVVDILEFVTYAMYQIAMRVIRSTSCSPITATA